MFRYAILDSSHSKINQSRLKQSIFCNVDLWQRTIKCCFSVAGIFGILVKSVKIND